MFIHRFLFCMVVYFFGLLVILRRYTRLPNISSIINVLTCIFLLSLCTVILMWKPFYFIFIDFVHKLRNGSFYHDCCKFAEIFFLHICFYVYFFPDVFYLRHGDAPMSIIFVCHGSLPCFHMAFVPVGADIYAQFSSFYLEIYKYILYPMLSYRFIADTAIFLWYYKLYAFCSVQRNNIL